MNEITLLLDLLDASYETHAWQGPNLRGALRGVRAEQAAWRPAPGRHSIQELTVHAAYWKYVVRRMLEGGPRGGFAEKGSNWFPRRGVLDERGWRADRDLLDAEHRALRAAAARLTRADLARKPGKSKHPAARLLYGVASHDVYHTGQIQLLKRLYSDRRTTAV